MPRARSAVLALGVALAACGNEPAPVPDVRTPENPRGERNLNLKAAGVQLDAPRNWDGIAPDGPLAGGVESRRATLAVWRYPRVEPLPATRGQLRRVRELLLERVRVRDPTFEPRAVVADYKAGNLTMWSSTQVPHFLRLFLSLNPG